MLPNGPSTPSRFRSNLQHSQGSVILKQRTHVSHAIPHIKPMRVRRPSPALLFLSATLLSLTLMLGIVLARHTSSSAHASAAAAGAKLLTDTHAIHLPILVQVDTNGGNPTPVGAEATATASPTPQPSNSIEWDPRLDQRGAVLVPAQPVQGQGYWRLIRGQWFDEQESGGRHHIYADTLDENGNRQIGVPLLVTWADGSDTLVTEAKPGEPAANFNMGVWGPAYNIQPDDGNLADRVNGLGLGSIEQPRFNIHTSYSFTWQWTIYNPATSTPQPTSTATPLSTTVPTVTPTMLVSITPTVTGTSPISATVTPTGMLTPSATSSPNPTSSSNPTSSPTFSPTSAQQPTLIPTSTPSQVPTTPPEPSQTPSPTATPTPTVFATPVVDDQYQFNRGKLVDCTGDPSQIRVNGTVYVDDEPATGYFVFFNFEEADNQNLNPVTTRDNPPGFYEHIVSGDDQWYVWIIDEERNRISVSVPFIIEEAKDGCRIATVNFYGNSTILQLNH